MRDRPHPFPTTQEGQLALVLWIAWDPVGGAPDEYVSYADQVLELLQAASKAERIASHLSKLRTDQMGMPPDTEADLRAAWAVQDWYQWFVEREDPPHLDRRESK